MDEEKLKLAATTIARCVQKFMTLQENREKFERWYESVYHHTYEWRKQ